MEPRRSESINKKYSTIPSEISAQIVTAVEGDILEQGSDDTVQVQGFIYPKEIIFSLGWRKSGEIKQVNFEASIDFVAKEKAKAFEYITLLAQAASSMFAEYMGNSGDIELPQEWTPFQLDKYEIHLRCTSTNYDLEAEADRLLEQDESNNEPAD
jgi:hypothetical protein